MINHIDYWINDSIGVDVKSNKWWKGNGCVELKVPEKYKSTYIKYAYNKPVDTAVWNSSWSEPHTNKEEWLVFKMEDGFYGIDRGEFNKLIKRLLKEYCQQHPTHKLIANNEKYNPNKPFTLFSNQNSTQAVWLMPIPNLKEYMTPLEDMLKGLTQ